MSVFLPSPSMMVVFSLETTTRLAEPRSSRLVFSRLRPDFLGDHIAAGEDGDVLEHLLAPVAEARAP